MKQFRSRTVWEFRSGLVARLTVILGLAIGGFAVAAPPADASARRSDEAYTTQAVHDRDGIGKFYLGREIAHVMGHQGADWLERPERAEEERPDQLMKTLAIKPGQSAADIGAGTGYMTRRLSKEVGPQGKVFAVDIQPEMIELLKSKMAEAGITNVAPVLGTEQDPGLAPGSVDWVLMVDVYHEFAFPREMLKAIRSAMKPGGRIVFVEYRKEDEEVPIKLLHKMSEDQVRREAEANGFEWERTDESLPRQHIIVFRKPQGS